MVQQAIFRLETNRMRTHYFWLVAHGPDFDVDNYVSISPLQIDEVWRRGDKRPESELLRETSGLSIELGRGTEDSAEEQQEIAAAFLNENEAALTRLRSLPGVETFYLGLELTVDPKSKGSIMDMLPSLMQIALKIGIQITVWATIEPESRF
jgi:hypothetical protein